MKHFLFVLVGTMVLISCAHKIVESTQTSNTSSSSTGGLPVAMTDEVSSGKQLFETKCAKCHAEKTISEHSETQWNSILDRMIPKAKMDDTEGAHVRAYVAWELAQ